MIKVLILVEKRYLSLLYGVQIRRAFHFISVLSHSDRYAHTCCVLDQQCVLLIKMTVACFLEEAEGSRFERLEQLDYSLAICMRDRLTQEKTSRAQAKSPQFNS